MSPDQRYRPPEAASFPEIMRTALWTLAIAALTVAVPFPAGADVESELNAVWRGRDVVALIPLHSACDGFYNNNEVVGAPAAPRVSGGGARSFAAGELVRVERLDAKRNRLDVFLDVAEPVLLERREGPFTLYDERHCKVQLQVEVPRETLRSAETAAATLSALLEQTTATESAAWNRRRREDYPAGYERTLAEYEAWKVEQVNAAVGAKLESVSDEASRIADRIRRDPDYLDGFAAGVEQQRDRNFGGCEALVSESFASARRGPPSDRGGAEDRGAWERGWDDGQRLAWSLEMLHRLPGCLIR